MKKIKFKRDKKTNKFKLPEGAYSFVIGNGTSRSNCSMKRLADYGVVIACNWFFKKEFAPHVLVCSDEPITKNIAKNFKHYPKANHMYTWFPKPGSWMKKIPTPEKMSAGVSAAAIGCEVIKSEKVFLLGMDFFGFGSVNSDANGIVNNLYAGEEHYVAEGVGAPTYRNWQRRFQYILRAYPGIEFYHVNPFEGKSPERLRGFDNFHQISYENLVDHLENDAELVDLLVKTEDDVQLAIEDNPDDVRACVERQVVGQENVIFHDLLHPDDVMKMRLSGREYYAKHGFNAPGVMDIMGFQIQAPQFGFAYNPNTEQFIKLSDEMMGKEYEKECVSRQKLVQEWYSEHPTQTRRALTIPEQPEVEAPEPLPEIDLDL